MRTWIGVVGIVVLLTVALPVALAQPPEPGGPRSEGPPRMREGVDYDVFPGDAESPPRMREPGQDRDVRGLVESVMAARLSEELGLNDEQTVLMIRRFSEFKKEMNERKKQRGELLRELKTVLQEGTPDEEIAPRLEGLLRHDQESVEFKRGIYERACEGLSVAQRAKMYVFLNEFETDMRKLIERARETRRERFRGLDSFDPRRPPDMDQPPHDMPGPMPGMEGRMQGQRPPGMEGRMQGQRSPGMEGRMQGPGRRAPRMQGGSPEGQQDHPPEGPPERGTS